MFDLWPPRSRCFPILSVATLLAATAAQAETGRTYVVVPVAESVATSAEAIEVGAAVESTIRAGGEHTVIGRVGMPNARIAEKIRSARVACKKAEAAFLELETETAREANQSCVKGLMGRLDLVNDPSAVARAFILRGTLATLLGNDGDRLPAFERALSLDAAASTEGLFLPKGDVEAIEARQSDMMFTAPGVLHFETNVPAAIYVDGRFYGTTPGDVRIVAGRHEWALRRPGYQRKMGTAVIGEGVTDVTQELTPLGFQGKLDEEAAVYARDADFWQAKTGGITAPVGAAQTDLAIFVRLNGKVVDLLLVDRAAEAPIAHQHVPIAEDLVSTRPAIVAATTALLKLSVGAPPLAERSQTVAAKTDVPPPVNVAHPAVDDESDGGGLLLWGGVAAATTVVVIGSAAAVTAAILFAPSVSPPAQTNGDRDPFSGGDGQARRRVGLGL